MPSLPPFARREKVSTYEKECGGVVWCEERIKAADGVELGILVGGRREDGRMRMRMGEERSLVKSDLELDRGEGEKVEGGGEKMMSGRGRRRRRVVVVYFQGFVAFLSSLFFFRLILG